MDLPCTIGCSGLAAALGPGRGKKLWQGSGDTGLTSVHARERKPKDAEPSLFAQGHWARRRTDKNVAECLDTDSGSESDWLLSVFC